jgi:hypothetical protein
MKSLHSCFSWGMVLIGARALAGAAFHMRRS